MAHVEGFLEPALADLLAVESSAILLDTAPWIHPEAYSVGSSAWFFRNHIDASVYPAMAEVFDDPFLKELVRRHYVTDYVYGDKIYVIYDAVGQDHVVQQLHYDKTQHLKLFIYLSDVDSSHGPFRCVPGSHRFAAAAQARNRADGVIPTDADTRMLPDSYPTEVVHVLGPRGTLIAFDSDIAHAATPPTSGPRLGVRSLNPGPFSPRRDR